MYGVIMLLVILISMVWVYWDATQNRIGKIPGLSGLLNMSAFSWALLTGFIWIVGFPFYLYKRSVLKQESRLNGVDVRNRNIKLINFILVGLFIFMLVYTSGSFDVDVQLPKCEDKGTIEVAKAAFHSLLPDTVIQLKRSTEIMHNKVREVRLCRAQLNHQYGTVDVYYKVYWVNKNQGEFFVEPVNNQ